MKKIIILTLLIFGTATFTFSASGLTLDDCVDYMNNLLNQEERQKTSNNDQKQFNSMMDNDRDYSNMMEEDIDDMPCH